MPRLKDKYTNEVVDQLKKDLNCDNVMAIPRVNKIVVNIGIGEAIKNSKALDAAIADLTAITGQKPISIKSSKSISQFGLRKGDTVGVKVTLRGNRMWEFLDKLVSVVLPRIREFNGVSNRAWDGRGNYTLGLNDQTVFPEIEFDKVDKVRGLEICINTSAATDEAGRQLLTRLGMPFSKD